MSSSSPVYLGVGSAREREAAIEAMLKVEVLFEGLCGYLERSLVEVQKSRLTSICQAAKRTWLSSSLELIDGIKQYCSKWSWFSDSDCEELTL